MTTKTNPFAGLAASAKKKPKHKGKAPPSSGKPNPFGGKQAMPFGKAPATAPMPPDNDGDDMP